jgi:hypothetical protein
MKGNKFPSEEQLAIARKELSKGIASKPLQSNATPIEIIKHEICREFVKFKNSNKSISQKKLAEHLQIDEALMCKILNYHVDEFTIDRLIKYLAILHPEKKFSIKIA